MLGTPKELAMYAAKPMSLYASESLKLGVKLRSKMRNSFKYGYQLLGNQVVSHI